MAVFVSGENMVVHGKDVFKVVLRFVVGGILKERFVWNVDFVEGRGCKF